jgi:hypothetical protein
MAMMIYPTRCADTTLTTGLGPLGLSGIPPQQNLRSPVQICNLGDMFYADVSNRSAAEWEEGRYTYTAIGQLTRTQILQSSNGNNAVNFSPGIKDVVLTVPALTVQLADQAISSAGTGTVSSTLQVSLSPFNFGTGGSYQLVSKSGVMAAGLASTSPIWAFRNSSISLLIVLKRIRISAWSLTGFTAGLGTFELFRAINWLAGDTGGVTDTISTPNGELRAATMPPTHALAEIRHASTGTLTAGTRTLDAQSLESLNINVPATANFAFVPSPTSLFAKPPGEYPLVLGPSEGVVIQATVPATGTWAFAITQEWDECTTYTP